MESVENAALVETDPITYSLCETEDQPKRTADTIKEARKMNELIDAICTEFDIEGTRLTRKAILNRAQQILGTQRITPQEVKEIKNKDENDYLNSKIEAGRMELEHQPFGLHDCLEGALDLLGRRVLVDVDTGQQLGGDILQAELIGAARGEDAGERLVDADHGRLRESIDAPGLLRVAARERGSEVRQRHGLEPHLEFVQAGPRKTQVE